MNQGFSGKTVDVIIIGAGFAGLSAATALAEAGLKVHVLEARPGLGGRATAFRDPVTGERIDNGQHVLAGCYTETLTFLRRIGAADKLHRPTTLRLPMIDEDGRPSVLAFPPLPSPFHLFAGLLAWDALSLSDKFSVLRMRRAFGGRLLPEPGVTVRRFLEQQRQSPRLCRMLWEPLALATLNQSIDDASAEAFLAVVSRLFGPEPDASALLLPAVPLDDLYANPAKTFLEAAESLITTNARALVVVNQDRVIGAQIRDELIQAPVVISAVPWFALADLFITPPDELRAIVTHASDLGSSPIVTVNLWLKGAELDEPVVGLPGRVFQWVFDKRRLVGSSQSHLSLVSSGADEICTMPNPTVTETALRELRTAIPAFERAAVRHMSVVRERRATFSLRAGSPPRPAPVTPLTGFFLAGDWIATGLPATIESAVVSGHLAAQAALQWCQSSRTIKRSR